MLRKLSFLLGIFFFMQGAALELLYAASQDCGKNWICFSNPNSPKAMEEQIYEEVFRRVKNKEWTLYKNVKAKEQFFDQEKRQIEKKWEEGLDSFYDQVRNGLEQIQYAKFDLSDYRAIVDRVRIKRKQLQEEELRLDEQDKIFAGLFDNLSYQTLVLGIMPQNESRKVISNKLNAAMGKYAVQSVKDYEIQSLSVVRNHQQIVDLIQERQRGHYSSKNNYGKPLDLLNQKNFDTDQIELTVFQVFPFQIGKQTGKKIAPLKSELSLLTSGNYQRLIKKLTLEENIKQELRIWIYNELFALEAHNEELENKMESRRRRWQIQRNRIRNRINQLKKDIITIELSLKPLTTDLQDLEKEWRVAYQKYQSYLNRRVVWLRRREGRTLGPNVKKEEHWATLGKQTLSILTDLAGDYDRRIIVADRQIEEWSEKALHFKEKKIAFRVLYVSANRTAGITNYITSIAYQIALSPVGAELSGFVLIQPGSFLMGSNQGDADEKPPHQVRLTKSFWMAESEVTVASYRKFIEATGYREPNQCDWGEEYMNWGKSNKENYPINCVSWDDTQKYIVWLNQEEPKEKYRLCTEAEWEYAGRAGTTTKWSCGNGASCLNEVAWYDNAWNNTKQKGTRAVKTKRPNPWGLFDMHGNVWEWVHDWHGEYTIDQKVNPKGPKGGVDRVIRGGSFYGSANNARSASRSRQSPGVRDSDLGFRLCRN